MGSDDFMRGLLYGALGIIALGGAIGGALEQSRLHRETRAIDRTIEAWRENRQEYRDDLYERQQSILRDYADSLNELQSMPPFEDLESRGPEYY